MRFTGTLISSAKWSSVETELWWIDEISLICHRECNPAQFRVCPKYEVACGRAETRTGIRAVRLICQTQIIPSRVHNPPTLESRHLVEVAGFRFFEIWVALIQQPPSNWSESEFRELTLKGSMTENTSEFNSIWIRDPSSTCVAHSEEWGCYIPHFLQQLCAC